MQVHVPWIGAGLGTSLRAWVGEAEFEGERGWKGGGRGWGGFGRFGVDLA